MRRLKGADVVVVGVGVVGVAGGCGGAALS